MSREYSMKDYFVFLAATAAILVIGWTFMGNAAFLTATYTQEGPLGTGYVYQDYYLQNFEYKLYIPNHGLFSEISLYVDSLFLDNVGEAAWLWAIMFWDGFTYMGLGLALTFLLAVQMWFRYLDRTSRIPIRIRTILLLQLMNLLLPPLIFIGLFATLPPELNPSGYLVLDLFTYLLHFSAALLLGIAVYYEIQQEWD
ncbi:MAG: hypothetical protein ACFFCZ_03970 [Promethearchaeota archaeon]